MHVYVFISIYIYIYTNINIGTSSTSKCHEKADSFKTNFNQTRKDCLTPKTGELMEQTIQTNTLLSKYCTITSFFAIQSLTNTQIQFQHVTTLNPWPIGIHLIHKRSGFTSCLKLSLPISPPRYAHLIQINIHCIHSSSEILARNWGRGASGRDPLVKVVQIPAQITNIPRPQDPAYSCRSGAENLQKWDQICCQKNPKSSKNPEQYLTQLWKIIIDITDIGKLQGCYFGPILPDSLSISRVATHSLPTASMSRSQARTIRRMWFTSPLLFPQVTGKYSPTQSACKPLGEYFLWDPTWKRT